MGPGQTTKRTRSPPTVERRNPAIFKGCTAPTQSELILQARELVRQAREAFFDDARDLYGRAAVLFRRAGHEETAEKMLAAARKADPLTNIL